MAWVGPQHDRVILPTAGNVESVATSVFDGVSGDYVIGGYTVNNSVDSDYYHAAVWTNHGSTFTDLNPSAFTYSAERRRHLQHASRCRRQWPGRWTRWLLWKGSASSVVDLNGSSDSSIAYGADQSHQVGSSGLHAAVWSGSAADMVHLQPPPAILSRRHWRSRVVRKSVMPSSAPAVSPAPYSGTLPPVARSCSKTPASFRQKPPASPTARSLASV